MSSMSGPNYKTILYESLDRYAKLDREREAIEIEIDKLDEFIKATMNLLPEEDRAEFAKLVTAAATIRVNRLSSLTEAIRRILREVSDKRYLTAAEVRDRLVSAGFDFSEYISNPLSSVSTTLRRMKPAEVETAEIQGVAGYRWVGPVLLSSLSGAPESSGRKKAVKATLLKPGGHLTRPKSSRHTGLPVIENP
jgi:hypothetical protein